eukprot:scaffold6528_cov114-Cylindrotheca_fusiformis.AAC.15
MRSIKSTFNLLFPFWSETSGTRARREARSSGFVIKYDSSTTIVQVETGPKPPQFRILQTVRIVLSPFARKGSFGLSCQFFSGTSHSLHGKRNLSIPEVESAQSSLVSERAG